MKYITSGDTVGYSISENEYVIYQSSKEMLLVINKLGAYIWNCLKKQQTIDDIVRSICKDFVQEDKVKVKKDLLNFVNHLKEHGLVSIVE